MNLFDAYGSASKHDLIMKEGMPSGVPPHGTFIETLAAVSELLGYNDVFSHDWVVIHDKPSHLMDPPIEADRPSLQEVGPHFPDIMVDADGMIVLCPGCTGSDASKDGDYFICRACGSVWRQ